MTDSSINKFLKEKQNSKKMLAQQLSFSANKPLLGIFLDQELNKDGVEMLKEILVGLKTTDISVIILADTNLGSFEKQIILPYNRENRKLLLEASDIALPLNFSDVEELLLHGTVPVSNGGDKLLNYDPNKESGNSFLYNEQNPWAIFAALVRARETLKFPYDWRHIVRQGLEAVCRNA